MAVFKPMFEILQSVVSADRVLLPPKLAKILSNVLERKLCGGSARYLSSELTSQVHKLCKKYEGACPKIIPETPKDFVFFPERLLPMTTIGWKLASLEIVLPHEKYLGEFGSFAYKRLAHAIRRDYGEDAFKLVAGTRSDIMQSSHSWNDTLWEICVTHTDSLRLANKIYREESVCIEVKRRFVNTVCSIYEDLWTTNAMQSIESASDRVKRLAPIVGCESILYMDLIAILSSAKMKS